ncbi:MAG: hypothetical protein PVG90_03045, partial [Bacillota bacterium]
MSFGNATVFPFPAVQYIPLPLTTLTQNRFGASHPQTVAPQIIVGPEVPKQLRFLNIPTAHEDPAKFSSGVLPLLALNLRINDVKYRGHLVTLLGKAQPGLYQLAVIPRQYFYKKTLFFEMYDEDNFER